MDRPTNNDRDGPPQPLGTPRSPPRPLPSALLVYQEPLSVAAWFFGWTRPLVVQGTVRPVIAKQRAPPPIPAPPSSSPPFRPRLSWTDRRQPMINHVVSPVQPSPVLSHPSQQHHFPISRISTCTYIRTTVIGFSLASSKLQAHRPQHTGGALLADSGELSLSARSYIYLGTRSTCIGRVTSHPSRPPIPPPNPQPAASILVRTHLGTSTCSHRPFEPSAGQGADLIVTRRRCLHT